MQMAQALSASLVAPADLRQERTQVPASSGPEQEPEQEQMQMAQALSASLVAPAGPGQERNQSPPSPLPSAQPCQERELARAMIESLENSEEYQIDEAIRRSKAERTHEFVAEARLQRPLLARDELEGETESIRLIARQELLELAEEMAAGADPEAIEKATRASEEAEEARSRAREASAKLQRCQGAKAAAELVAARDAELRRARELQGEVEHQSSGSVPLKVPSATAEPPKREGRISFAPTVAVKAYTVESTPPLGGAWGLVDMDLHPAEGAFRVMAAIMHEPLSSAMLSVGDHQTVGATLRASGIRPNAAERESHKSWVAAEAARLVGTPAAVWTLALTEYIHIVGVLTDRPTACEGWEWSESSQLPWAAAAAVTASLAALRQAYRSAAVLSKALPTGVTSGWIEREAIDLVPKAEIQARSGEKVEEVCERLAQKLIMAKTPLAIRNADWAQAAINSATIEPPDIELALATERRTFSHSMLKSVATVPRPLTLSTKWLARLPEQSPTEGFSPRHPSELMLAPYWRIVQRFMAELQDFLAGEGRRPTAVALDQGAFVMQARGRIWDLRHGHVQLLQFNQGFDPQLNVERIRALLGGIKDQELLSFLIEGTRFKSPSLLHVVLQAPLMSFVGAAQSAAVGKELTRLAKCGRYEYALELPFLPVIMVPPGTVPRKLELDRPRRIGDNGAPRGVLYSRPNGEPVVPVNVAAGPSRPDRAHQYHRHAAPTGCKENALAFQRRAHFERVTRLASMSDAQIEATYSKLVRDMYRAYEGAEPKWHREVKPSVKDMCTALVPLLTLAEAEGVPTILVVADFADYFHFHSNSPEQWWQCVMAVPRQMLQGDELPEWIKRLPPRALIWVIQLVLEMGAMPSSNICQREADVIISVIVNLALEMYAARVASDGESEARREWRSQRQELARTTGNREDSLIVAFVFTDDPAAAMPEDLVELYIAALEEVAVRTVGLELAKMLKWSVGPRAQWNGVIFDTLAAVVFVTREKAEKAAEDLHRLQQCLLDSAAARAMFGLLEHLAYALSLRRHDLMYPLWRSLNMHVKEHGEDSLEGVQLDEPALLATEKWLSALAMRTGTSILAAVTGMPPPEYSVAYTLAQDAALIVGPGEMPGIGGHLYQRIWGMPLPPRLVDLFNIVELECMAPAINLIMYDFAIPEQAVVDLASDSLATVLSILKGHADAITIDFIVHLLQSLSEYQRRRSRIFVRHLVGTGNELADRASRGDWKAVAGIYAAMRTRWHRDDAASSARVQWFIGEVARFKLGDHHLRCNATARLMAPQPTPRRVHVQHERYDVYCGRASAHAPSSDYEYRWGNPFKGAKAAERFTLFLFGTAAGRMLVADARRLLRGRTLACWCAADEPCHADALLIAANCSSEHLASLAADATRRQEEATSSPPRQRPPSTPPPSPPHPADDPAHETGYAAWLSRIWQSLMHALWGNTADRRFAEKVMELGHAAGLCGRPSRAHGWQTPSRGAANEANLLIFIREQRSRRADPLLRDPVWGEPLWRSLALIERELWMRHAARRRGGTARATKKGFVAIETAIAAYNSRSRRGNAAGGGSSRASSAG